jgi:hypothetical protein
MLRSGFKTPSEAQWRRPAELAAPRYGLRQGHQFHEQRRHCRARAAAGAARPLAEGVDPGPLISEGGYHTSGETIGRN